MNEAGVKHAAVTKRDLDIGVASLRERGVVSLALGNLDTVDQAYHLRIAKARARHMLETDPPMDGLYRDGEGYRILRRCRRLGNALEKAHPFMEGVDADFPDIVMCQVVRHHQFADAVDRCMGPAADRIGFHILVGHDPARAEVRPDIRHLVGLNGDRRRAGEPLLGKDGGRNPDHGTPPRPVMKHARAGDLAHHLASRPVIFGDADGLAELRPRQPADPRCESRNAKGVPRPGSVVVADGRMKRQTGTPGDLVAKSDQRQRLVPADRIGLLGQCKQRRDNRDPDMALDRIVTVMRVQIVGLGRGGIGGPGKADTPSVEQHRRLEGRVTGGIESCCRITRKMARIHRGGGRGNPERVEAHESCSTARLSRHI